MQHLRTKRAAIAVALLAAVALAACGGAAQPASTATQAPAPTSAAAAPTSAPPTETSSTPTAAGAAAAPTDSPSQTAPAAAAASKKLNLNEVTEEELLGTIPNFGNRMVREFFEYRPYVSIQQFRREIGKYVDEAQVAEYEKYVFVPVSPNEADAETLQQLPGVDASIAETLIAGRPYASNAAFLEKLGESVSADDAAAAAVYLAAE